MAEETEKDYTWWIAGVAIAAVIVLVVLLKKDETKHLQSGAVEQLQTETFQNIEKRKTSNITGNVGVVTLCCPLSVTTPSIIISAWFPMLCAHRYTQVSVDCR